MIDLRMYQRPEFDTLDADNCRVHVELISEGRLNVFVEKEDKSVLLDVRCTTSGRLIVEVKTK